jgi:hypothetical protein
MRLPLHAVLVVASCASLPALAFGQAAPAPTAPVAAVAVPVEDERPWLGINISREGYLGVLVTDVIEDTPAEACGLLPGDEILEIDGVRVVDGDELIATVSSHRVGDDVRVVYLRNGETAITIATLSARIDDRNEVFHRRLVGRAAPPIDATWSDGAAKTKRKRLDNDDLRGDVVLLLLWSTSCLDCGPLAGALADFAADHAEGVRAFALSDESDEALAASQQHAPLALPIAADLDCRRRFFLATEPLGQPALLVIDHRGVVRFAALDVTGEHGRLDDALLAASRALRDRERVAR